MLVLWPLAAAVLPAAPGPAPDSRPRLAIVISIDQFRGDYLTKFRPYFGEGGFKRLMDGGTDFHDSHHRHSITITAPGHAGILTGVHANVHGITANEWVDRGTWDKVNCVEDPASPLVGIAAAELGPVAAGNPAKTGRSPRNFRAETVGDMLKQRYGADMKIFAVSNKDRSAILLGGKKADAVYWDENGRFITSRYYCEALPAWVEAFNAERRVHAAFGQTWDRLLDAKIYESVQGPDDAIGEVATASLPRTMPKTINGGKSTITPSFFSAFDASPFSAEFLEGFVERAIQEEKLGHHPGTDLLCVSFSQIDVIGHAFGPDSHEVMDSILRLDRVIARLMDFIDREIGLGRCVIVVTADHGVAPIPEQVQARQGTAAAGRIKFTDIDAAVKKALDGAYGALAQGETWFIRDNAGFHLRPAALSAKKVGAAEAAKVVRAALVALPFVEEAYTREELLAADANGTSTLAMMRRSYRADSDRDVVFVGKPNFIATGNVSTHGSPHPYDTHVAQLWFGMGVPKSVRTERVGVDDIAPTLAGLLGVAAPSAAKGRRLF